MQKQLVLIKQFFFGWRHIHVAEGFDIELNELSGKTFLVGYCKIIFTQL